jgi:phage terminase small subunit
MRGFYRYDDFIGELDRGVFSAYCQSYGRWVAAEAALKALVDDSVAANLLLGIANTAMRDMVRFADKLGMTPTSRARILATSAGQPLGKKEAAHRAALSTAQGRFGPAPPPRLVVVGDDDEDLR